MDRLKCVCVGGGGGGDRSCPNSENSICSKFNISCSCAGALGASNHPNWPVILARPHNYRAVLTQSLHNISEN